jgi:adenine-specific DNA-methyltransferase
MGSLNKLELTWIGKGNRPRLEPRILLEDPALSYHAKQRVTEKDIFDNRLIFGDNLLALKALESEFTGKIKCVFIDPPYNTGSAFTHYDDGLEHSIWLSMMRDRLEIIQNLLAEDGSCWITIDDNEAHYLKVLCDEVFGRKNFLTTIIWQKKYAGKPDSRFFSEFHDYILVYAKNQDAVLINGTQRTTKQDSRYKNPDNDPRGDWASDNLLRTEERDYAIFPIQTPSGKEYCPPKGSSWRFTKERISELIIDKRIWFGTHGSNMPRLKRFLSEVTQSLPPSTWWQHEESGHNSEAKKEVMNLLPEVSIFPTPKPERLLKKIIEIASNPDDLILDSFAGSGTTGAVAHKMGRRWILIELGEHCHTHIIPRLKKVIDGEDKGGITEAANWKGGGGFRYFRLAPSLLEKDEWGNWIINPKYNPAMLAEAMCKHEGFTYAPSEKVYWIHGQSTERDFIYVTTQILTQAQLQRLGEEVGVERSLLICCRAFRGKAADFTNLTVKKIPNAILNRCDFGKDDYSLKIANLPIASVAETVPDLEPSSSSNRKQNAKRKTASDTQQLTFLEE